MLKTMSFFKKREQEMEFVSIVSDVTAEIDLSSLLKRVMEEATKMLMQIERHYFLTMKKHRNFFQG